VRQNPSDFSHYREYDASVDEENYTHPDYYYPVPQAPSYTPRSQQEEEPYAEQPAYVDYPGPVVPATSDPSPYGQLQEYRGPEYIEGYTTDIGSEQRAAAEQGTTDGGKVRKRAAGLGGIALMIGSWLLKLKGLLFLLKFGTAAVTALITVALYSLLFGWAFAIGFVLLIFIHELGHALVLKLKGIAVSGMVFIPFVAAAVFWRTMPRDAKEEAEIAIAGPIAGAIASAVCLFIAQTQPHHTLWAPLAYMGFFLNLFNMIPIVPLDGGRVLGAIDRRAWLLGFLGLFGLQVWYWLHGITSIWLLLLVVVAASQLWSRGFSAPQTAEAREYYNVPMGARISLTVLYFGLSAVLFMGMTIAHSMIPGAQ